MTGTTVQLAPHAIRALREIADIAEGEGAVHFLKVARLTGYLDAALDAVSDA